MAGAAMAASCDEGGDGAALVAASERDGAEGETSRAEMIRKASSVSPKLLSSDDDHEDDNELLGARVEALILFVSTGMLCRAMLIWARKNRQYQLNSVARHHCWIRDCRHALSKLRNMTEGCLPKVRVPDGNSQDMLIERRQQADVPQIQLPIQGRASWFAEMHLRVVRAWREERPQHESQAFLAATLLLQAGARVRLARNACQMLRNGQGTQSGTISKERNHQNTGDERLLVNAMQDCTQTNLQFTANEAATILQGQMLWWLAARREAASEAEIAAAAKADANAAKMTKAATNLQ
eukprot:541761-Pleurochrysis_carterae.AAC.1